MEKRDDRDIEAKALIKKKAMSFYQPIHLCYYRIGIVKTKVTYYDILHKIFHQYSFPLQ